MAVNGKDGTGSSSGRFAYAIVWTPIPILTWLYPFIGHMGVCSSEGVTYDFAGPYTVSEGNLLFGKPTRFLQLEPRSATSVFEKASSSGADSESAHQPPMASGGGAGVAASQEGGHKTYGLSLDLASIAQAWDWHLRASVAAYSKRGYGLLTDNCHCFVAHFLNAIKYKASDDWNMIRLAALVFLNARHTSLRGVLWTWAPFILLAVPCAIFGRLVFLYVWLAGGGALMLWFAIYSYCLQGRRSVACGSGA